MGLLDFLGLGSSAGQAIAQPVEAVGGVLDSLFTSDEERMTRQEALERLRQQPHLAQIALNATEAQHRSVFVAGWRPFIGWVCGVALAWHFMAHDLTAWACSVWWPDILPPVLSGTESLITIVLSLLGLGAMRTVEKAKGLTK